jgi:NADPH-dependent curcumin reductase CurA
MMTRSREVQLKRRPVGLPKADDFQIVEVDVPAPAAGEVLVKNVCMSVDPYMRGRMVDRKSYVPPFQLGETMTGGAIGRVVESKHPQFKAGDYVENGFAWREAFTAKGEMLSPLGKLVAPASAYLGALGMPGMTAYVGLLEVGALKDGETVFVSGAAGAVGSIVGQIAKIKGCHVVGSAGSAAKVRLLTEELGFDRAFDYHGGDLLGQLRDAAPKGLDVYFDNVGGDHLQAALSHMRQFGRIPLCGAIAQYNDTIPPPGPNNLTLAIGLGLTLRGFIVSHFNHLRAQFRRDMESWIGSGTVKYRETIMHGIERAPEAFIGLFTGENVGKMVVQLEE